MSEFKEFQGKSLDVAIQAACDFFEMKRDKLEIEIITGGSSGIFGLVGVKKAKVKARPRAGVKPMTAPAANDTPREDRQNEKKQETAKREEKKAPRKKPASRQNGEDRAQGAEKKKPVQKTAVKPEKKKVDAPKKRNAAPQSQKPAPQKEVPQRKEIERQKDDVASAPVQEQVVPKAAEAEEFVDHDMTALDQDKLLSVTQEVTSKLLEAIIGETKLEITVDPDRVNVFIDDEEHSGLIIGREGQTLSALQYLANRIVSRKMETSVRIQLDTGDYRERQDEKLRQIAKHLAEKALRSSRTQSTRPLSSYHRRVVHLALQENNSVFTRSKGDGPMKRVLIVPKRKRRNNYNIKRRINLVSMQSEIFPKYPFYTVTYNCTPHFPAYCQTKAHAVFFVGAGFDEEDKMPGKQLFALVIARLKLRTP